MLEVIFSIFGTILGAILEAKIDQKTKKNDIKNKTILRPMSRGVRDAPTRVVWGGMGLGGLVYVAPCSTLLKEWDRNPKSKTTKNEIQETIDRKSNEQRRNDDEKKDDVRDDGKSGNSFSYHAE